MPEFALTFGQQYAREVHPTFPGAHPDGFVIIEAPDHAAARLVAANHFAIYWCDLYTPETWPGVRHYFPRGELFRIPWRPSPFVNNPIEGG